MLDKKIVEKLVLLSIKRTAELAKAYPKKDVEKVEKMSEKEKELSRLIPEFGCYSERVSRLVFLLSGLKVKAPKEERLIKIRQIEKMPDLCALVALASHNSHNYRIGKVCMSVRGNSQCHMLRGDGTVGNNMSSYSVDSRPATPAEIRKFLSDPKVISEIEKRVSFIVL